MKYDSILRLFVLGVMSVFFGGCKDAEYSPIRNLVYISEAAPANKFNQQVENLTVKGDTKTSIHVQLAQALSQDVHVTLGTDTGLAEEYNRRNGTDYAVLPDTYLTYSNTVTIPAGNISSEAVDINIGEFPVDDGSAYCIPLRITETDAPVSVSQNTGRILYLLSTPHMQVVPTLTKDTPASALSDWNIQTDAWTLEGWVWVKDFNINNQAIWQVTRPKSANEVYIRFGDADVDYDKLQIKIAGSQFNSNLKFQPETWYHIAFVTGNGKCTMYINGSEDSSITLANSSYLINGLELVPSSGWFTTDGKMAQVRFWKKALPQSAIQDAMNRQVPANSEGLFGYWKLDEGEGSLFKDATSNGFDLQCAKAPVWSKEKVDFSDPNN